MSAPAELAYRHHNHDHCVTDALAAARSLCLERGVRLTALREQVLTLIWQNHRPLGAYAILDQLRADPASDRRPAPPTVYRTLEFLLEHGLVHRINALNAFVGCRLPHDHHTGYFLICRACSTTLEIEDESVAAALQTAASRAGFHADHAAVEIMGRCPNCGPADGDEQATASPPDAGAAP